MLWLVLAALKLVSVTWLSKSYLYLYIVYDTGQLNQGSSCNIPSCIRMDFNPSKMFGDLADVCAKKIKK